MLTVLVLRTWYIAMLLRSLRSFTTRHFATLPTTLKSQKTRPKFFQDFQSLNQHGTVVKSPFVWKTCVLWGRFLVRRDVSFPASLFVLLLCLSAFLPPPFFCFFVVLLRCFSDFCFPRFSACPTSLLLLCYVFAFHASLLSTFVLMFLSASTTPACLCLSIYPCLYLLSYPSLLSFFKCF